MASCQIILENIDSPILFTQNNKTVFCNSLYKKYIKPHIDIDKYYQLNLQIKNNNHIYVEKFGDILWLVKIKNVNKGMLIEFFIKKDNTLQQNENSTYAIKPVVFSQYSHEMQNQLHAVMGLTNLLLQETKLYCMNKHDIKKYASELMISAKRLSQIDKDFNMYRKNNKLTKNMSNIILSELFSEIESLMMYDIKNNNIRFKTFSSGLAINTDRNHLMTVLTNLVGNAIKYNKKGGSVLIKAHLKKYIEIEVKDTGVGIQMQDLKKIWNPFVRLKTKKCNGTGMGLAFVKNIVRFMNWDIAVNSLPNIGSVFILKIPYVKKLQVTTINTQI